MKKFLYLFILFLLLIDNLAEAQKIINEGTVSYKISIESLNGEKQLSGSLNGATLSLYLTKDKSKSEMTSSPGTESNVFDNTKGKGFILKEYSGQKLMITTTSENWKQKNQLNSSLNFSVDNEVVKILGYNCKKATAVSADGKSYTVYFDPSITISNMFYNNAFPQLKGLPVQYELSSGNLLFKYSLTGYTTDAITPSKFEAPKSGYRVMTYEENQQLKKGE